MINDALNRKEYLEKRIDDDCITAISIVIGIFLAGGITFAVLKNWLVLMSSIVGLTLPFDVYYYRKDKTSMELKELELSLKEMYFLQAKERENFNNNLNTINNDIELTNNNIIENYDFVQLNSSNCFRKIKKRKCEKKINFNIKN